MALNKEEFLALLKFKMEGDKVFSQRVQKIQSEITGVGTQSDKTAKSGRNLGFSLVSVAKKAAIVAPAWILMRKAMMSAFKTITDGMEHIKALDKALARATAVTSGVKNMEKFKKEYSSLVRSLMIETGKSAEQVSEAFYNFGTAGISASDSIEGMKVALKTSIAMMGDSNETSRVMADIYNVMGDRIEGASTAAEKFAMIGSTLTVLWKQNSFNLNEFNETLKQFASTAAVANLSLDEMFTLVATSATVGQRGSRVGTGLSTAITNLVKNQEMVQDKLGITLDFEGSSIFDNLELVITQISNIGSASDRLDATMSIFEKRSARIIAGISRQLVTYRKNVELLASNDLISRMGALTKEFERQKATIDTQLNITKAISNVTFEGVFLAVTGSQDMAAAFTDMNTVLQKMIPSIVYVGSYIHWITRLIKHSVQGLEDVLQIAGYLTVNPLDPVGAVHASQEDNIGIGELKPDNIITNSEAIIEKISGKGGSFEQNLANNFAKTIANGTQDGLTTGANKFLDDDAKKFGEKFGDVLSDSIKGAILGEDTDIFSALSDYLKESFAESVAKGIKESLFKSTGIDKFMGNMFGGITAGIGTASTTVAGSVAKATAAPASGSTSSKFSKLLQGIGAGAATFGGAGGVRNLIGLGAVSAVMAQGSGGGTSGKLGTGIAGLGAMLAGKAAFAGGMSAFKGAGNIFSGASQGLKAGGRTSAGMIGGGLSLVGGGLNVYSASKSGNVMGGIGGGLSMLGGGMMMTGIGAPIGAVLAIAGTLMSMFSSNKKKQTTVETRNETFTVSSKVDITNRRLEIINRNLVAIRDDLRSYILPNSAYFATQLNQEDQYSLHSRMGII